ncbi:hypothetical protein [Oryzihumus leptocrescens]|uniref:Transcriptional regulator, AbiEi antitoxin, Type IV TA system n=1 Tax=Oryzihumus leptocrescens TaxID=297536 RepID=A0A542ZNH9_9MICO|nr:hypothetical protein [Oryzihumus leptocrescens]TQL61846.1 hypothetical protein FB474_3266 [Oryzihumus leptocrescens]
MDENLPLAFSSADAFSRGVTKSALRHKVAHGCWMRVSRDVHAVPHEWSAATPAARLASASMARARAHHADKVLSHLSAASIHGYDLPLAPGTATWLTVDHGGNRPRRAPDVIVERASLAPEDVVEFGRPVLAVTSPARTVADCLRHLRLADAVALGDSALRSDPDLAASVHEVLARQRGWPGGRTARTAYRLLDGRRETWLESWSFARLWQLGVELPEPQVTVLDEWGRFVARVDAMWRAWGVVGEADGRMKYGLGPAGADLAARSGLREAFSAGAVFAEKRREDRLRDLGLEVVRWTLDDLLRRPDEVVLRVEAARRRGDARRFRGRLVSSPETALRKLVS